MVRTFVMPSVLAAIKSACIAILFLSLPVICNMGSMPRWFKRCDTAIGAIVILEPAESVILIATTRSFNISALLKSFSKLMPLGGFSSQVTVNFPVCKLVESLLKVQFLQLIFLQTFILNHYIDILIQDKEYLFVLCSLIF